MERTRTLPDADRTSTAGRQRIVVVDDEPELVQLFVDIFSDDYEVIAAPTPVAIAGIDALDPEVMLIGTVAPGSLAALTADEIVALARRHMRLRHVPIIVLSANPHVFREAQRLAGVTGVTVVSLPFDLATIQYVLSSVRRQAATSARA